MLKYHGEKRYCVLYKEGTPERNYMSHISDNYFVKQSNQQSIKDILGGSLGNRADAIKHHKKSEHKQKRSRNPLRSKQK